MMPTRVAMLALACGATAEAAAQKAGLSSVKRDMRLRSGARG
jgi:hypothetical protein